MPAVVGRSGPGYATAAIPAWGTAPMGGGGGAYGGGGGGPLGSLLDPELLRQAMLQGLQQKQGAYEEWIAGKQQARHLADVGEARTARAEKATTQERGDLRRRRARMEGEAEPAMRTARANATARDVAETAAVTGRVPTRISRVGTQQFATTDPLAMTGAQRSRFLPQGASLSAAPTRMDLGGIGSDVAFDSMIAADRARQREAYGMGRG